MTGRTAVDHTTEALRRIAAETTPGIWISLRDQADVLEDARRVDRAVEAGATLPLAGLTAAIKGNIAVAGLRTTAAHPDHGDVESEDAEAVARLRAAGAIVIGSTNMDQFATGLVGTRTPYGALESVTHPGRVSGGSSSGSAVAVARGLVDIALGTDTAGSGRVPAAFNGIVGVKCTRGLVPVTGVIPASRTYDCVSVFARDLATAATAARTLVGPSETDPLTRTWPADAPLAAPPRPVIGVPREADLATLDPERASAFATAAQRLERAGARLRTLDISGMIEAATLLYGGAIVAERAAAYGEFLATHPDGADPTVSTIAAAASGHDAAALVRDTERRDHAQRAAYATLAGVDALLVPTAPTHPTLAEVAADPIGANARIGTFTNFMNLLDLCGVAVPAADTSSGAFGVTVIARAFEDQVAMDVAALLTDEPPVSLREDGVPVVVFGAHLDGEPLNNQLTGRGARLVRTVATAAEYRMVALPGSPARPGVAPAEPGAGVSLAGELWSMPRASLAALLADVTPPLALGPVALDDGTTATGFLSTSMDGEDISALGGWRRYLRESAAREHSSPRMR